MLGVIVDLLALVGLHRVCAGFRKSSSTVSFFANRSDSDYDSFAVFKKFDGLLLGHNLRLS